MPASHNDISDNQPLLPSYKTPPVIEVICDVTFQALDGLKGPHFGLFWHNIRDEYPECDQYIRLGLAGKISDADTIFPLPRFWFVSKDKNFLIQLQDDRFIFNWRQVDAQDVYPRYGLVIERFKMELKRFETFVIEQELGALGIKECELTYINVIPQGDGWDNLSDIGSIFKDLDWVQRDQRFLRDPQTCLWSTSFSLPEDFGSLHVKLHNATRRIDNRPLLRFELNARGLGGDTSHDAIWRWFDLAHEWIVKGFTDLTTERMHKIWKRER